MVSACRQDCAVLHRRDLARSGNGDEPRLIPENGLFPGCVRAESVSPALHVVGVILPGGAATLYALQLVRQSRPSQRVAFPAQYYSQERMPALDFALRATERLPSPRVLLHWQSRRVLVNSPGSL